MHLEVFAGSEFKAFVEACRALDAGLDPNAAGSPKTLLAIEKGAVLKAGSPPNAKLEKGEIVRRAKDSKEDGPWIKLERGNVEVLKHTPALKYSKEAQSFDGKLFYSAAADEKGLNPISANSYKEKNQKTHPFLKVFTPNGQIVHTG